MRHFALLFSLILSVLTANADEAKKFYELSGQYYDNQNYDSAVILGEKVLPLLRQKGMKEEEADELSILSVCCMRQSNYDKALEYAKACNQLDRESGDADNISNSLNTIGSIYAAAKQPAEGETPQNYITNIRLQNARHLLDTHSELTMLDIALRCGYDDQSSFTRAFKRFFGITPSDYLQRK